MIEACKGSDYLVHTASPFLTQKGVFSGKVKNVKKDLIDPAVNGTISVLKGCAKYKVKKCVITSSSATMFYKKDPKIVNFGPQSWSDEEACDPYTLSKLLADKAVWKFMKMLPEERRFRVSTIHPGLAMGPTFTKTSFESQQIMCNVMNGTFKFLRIDIPMCDVRDVAEAHV